MSQTAAPNKLHVLDLGAVRVDENFIIANATIVTASKPDAVSRLIDVPISAYLVECADGNVLYDTGCHPDCMGPSGRWTQKHQEIGPFIGGEECTLPSRLKALGLTPDDIPFVVLSHLHNDHAGCIEFFSQSKLIVHEDEFAGALRHYALHDHTTNYVLKDIAAWLDKPRQWDLVRRDEDRRTIVRGVELLNFGSGHAYGMLGLAVYLKERPGFLLVSDACYCAGNWGPSGRRAGIIYDTLGYDRTLRRIDAYAASNELEVLFGHDAAQFQTLIKSPDGFYQ